MLFVLGDTLDAFLFKINVVYICACASGHTHGDKQSYLVLSIINLRLNILNRCFCVLEDTSHIDAFFFKINIVYMGMCMWACYGDRQSYLALFLINL